MKKSNFDEGEHLQRIKQRYEKMFPCVTFRDYQRARMNHFKRELVTGINRKYGGRKPPPDWWADKPVSV